MSLFTPTIKIRETLKHDRLPQNKSLELVYRAEYDLRQQHDSIRTSVLRFVRYEAADSAPYEFPSLLADKSTRTFPILPYGKGLYVMPETNKNAIQQDKNYRAAY